MNPYKRKCSGLHLLKQIYQIETEMGMEISVVPVVYKLKKTATLPTAISIKTEMGMEISVVPVVYKVKETNSNTPKLFKI